MSTVAIKEGERGKIRPHHAHAHTLSTASDASTNTLDAERADRISRLAGLERVATLRGANQHMAQGSHSNQQQSLGYFDNASMLHKSTVGSASATGSVGGSVHDSMDKMSEDADDGVSSAGLSDDGNASLVGFGEAASSTVSGPVSASGRMASAHGSSAAAVKLYKRYSDSPMEGVDEQPGGAGEGSAMGRTMPDTTTRTGAAGARDGNMEGIEQAEKIMDENMQDGGVGRQDAMSSPPDQGKSLGNIYFEGR